MNIETFQRLLERIEPELSKDEKKEKIVQIADMSRFVECYSAPLVLKGCMEYEINIMEHEGVPIGVLFCELQKIKKGSFHPSFYTPFSSDFFREQTNVKDFWFVFVEESTGRNLKQFDDFIEKHSLNVYYNRIFLFSFFESTIHQLK